MIIYAEIWLRFPLIGNASQIYFFNLDSVSTCMPGLSFISVLGMVMFNRENLMRFAARQK